MKKLFLFLLVSIFLISLVSAGNECIEPDYRWCWETDSCHETACVKPKIYWQFEDEAGYDVWSPIRGRYPYVVGGLYIKSGFEGIGTQTNGYAFYNENNWDDIDNKFDCDYNGCYINRYDYKFTLPYNGRTKIASVGERFTDCVSLISLDFEENGDYWAWDWAGSGWLGSGNCFDMKVVECYDNSDCSSGQICDKSGDWTTWNCKTKICDEEEVRCFGTNLQKCENNQWIDKGTILNKCGVLCLDDNNCPADEVSDKFCSGNNIMETRIDHYCFTNYQCTSSTQDVILETCPFKCEDIEGEGAICIEKICDEGELMCSEENALICQDNQWELKEGCEYGCEEGICKSKPINIPLIIGIVVFSLLIILIAVFISKKKKKN